MKLFVTLKKRAGQPGDPIIEKEIQEGLRPRRDGRHDLVIEDLDGKEIERFTPGEFDEWRLEGHLGEARFLIAADSNRWP